MCAFISPVQYIGSYLFMKLIFQTYWSSAAIGNPLSGLMRCVFRDALLHTTVVMRGYLFYFQLPVSFDQSGSSLIAALINQAILPSELLLTGCVLFSPHLPKEVEMQK